jgi:hypothetical protein
LIAARNGVTINGGMRVSSFDDNIGKLVAFDNQMLVLVAGAAFDLIALSTTTPVALFGLG